MSITEQTSHVQHGPSRAKPEKLSAIAVAAVVVGFDVWALTTLPIQAAIILTVAGALAFVGWLATTNAHPVKSRKVIATYLAAVSFQFIDKNLPSSWTRAKLIEPTTAGFVHVGASSGPWRVPIALPRRRRGVILAQMHSAVRTLRADARVVRADVFRAFLRPPGQPVPSVQGAPEADFDAVLLVETTTAEAGTQLARERVLRELVAVLRKTSAHTLVVSGSNARRIAPVDHERQGIFLFNYFSAETVETNLAAWQYTAGWFQDETGLTNSTVIQPVDPDAVPYRLVNHCRWDHLRDVLPSLFFKRSFRDFVLRVFEDNGVTPSPILYKLDRPVTRQSP